MKYRFNEEKFLKNFAIFSTGLTIGILIYKIATCGIAWISTIRIFWIGGKKYEIIKKTIRTWIKQSWI